MNHAHSIIVAYDHNGHRSALNVAEALESIAEVQLRSYDELRAPLFRQPDVALCVVIDDETLEKAHQVQVRLEDVPTFVIDGLGELKIELNGYAGTRQTIFDLHERTCRGVKPAEYRVLLITPSRVRPATSRRRRPSSSLRHGNCVGTCGPTEWKYFCGTSRRMPSGASMWSRKPTQSENRVGENAHLPRRLSA